MTASTSKEAAEADFALAKPNIPQDGLYPMINLIPQIKQPLWKVSELVVLQDRTQILRAVTSPLTREILRNVEDTLRFRKYYEEQLCQIYNYGLAFVNNIIMERLKTACWYVFALQLKCRRLKKSDSFVPHHIIVELSLHRKPASSWFAKRIIKKLEERPSRLEAPIKIIPLHSDYYTDEQLKAYVETPIGDDRTINYLTVVIEIAIGEKNSYRQPKNMQDDPRNITLTDEDEIYLGKVKNTLEENGDSLGRMCIKYIRPTAVHKSTTDYVNKLHLLYTSHARVSIVCNMLLSQF